MKFYFDFDDTLVGTRHLYPHTKGQRGREFVANHPDSVNTELVHKHMPELLREVKDNAIVVSNSPRNLVEALMSKHNFPEVPIIGSADKPCKSINVQEGGVVIGDSPGDIYFARYNNLPSIAYLESSPFTTQQIQLSAPSAVAEDFESLIEVLGNKLEINQPYNPDDYVMLEEIVEEEFPVSPLGDYYPVDTDKFRSSQHSKDILRYKSTKKFTKQEITRGKGDSYYYGGQFRNGSSFIGILNKFYRLFQEGKQSLGLVGSVQVVAVPNSMPEHGYLYDPNQVLAYNSNGRQGCRVMQRLVPVPSAHKHGPRNTRKHIGTMGIKNDISFTTDNIILIDDVLTSNSQMFSAASLIRSTGYNGNIICVPLGKTTHV